MEYKEIKKKSEQEIGTMLDEQRERLRELRFKDAAKQLKNVREILEVRKTIARLLTARRAFKKSADKAKQG